MSTSRNRYRLCEGLGLTQGPETTNLPALELDASEMGAFSILELVHTPGDSFVRKWPEFPVTDEALEVFKFFKSQLPNYPFLRRRFLPTVLMDNRKGRYFLQRQAYTRPGQPSMSSKESGVFDVSQIDRPEIMSDLVGITADGLRFTWDTAANPAIGKRAGEGLMFEVHDPKNFLRGILPGDPRDIAYIYDCHPILPVTWQGLEVKRLEIPAALDVISRKQFGTSLRDFSAAYGLPDVEAIAQLPDPMEGTRALREAQRVETAGRLATRLALT